MLAATLAILIVPLAAAVACLIMPGAAALRIAPALTVIAGITSFALVLALVPDTSHADLSYLSGYVRADAVSVIFLLATGFLYAAVAVYAVGYLRTHRDATYARRFYAGFNAFAWAMLAAPLMGSLALLWIAVEVTTIVSALLVAIEAPPTREGDGAAEAAWKYLLIASAGLGLALLATIFAYYAGAQVLGEHYDQAGPRLPATPVRLAFLLAVLGYGTKVGLFPVHTWLPDAHSQAPTPVSALLSRSLLAVSFYAILRFYQVAAASLGTGFPRDALLAFGVASPGRHLDRAYRRARRPVRQPLRPRCRRPRRRLRPAPRDRGPRRARRSRQARHRGRAGADGHLLVPGPAAWHRPAAARPCSRGRRPRPGRQGIRLQRRRPAEQALRRVRSVGPRGPTPR